MIKVLAAATLFLAAVLLLNAPQIAYADGPGDWPMFGFAGLYLAVRGGGK